MAKVNRLAFRNAELARDAIDKQAKKQIAKLYENWADEIGAEANRYSRDENASAAVKEIQSRELERMLRAQSQEVMREVNNNITSNIYVMSDEVVKVNNDWLKKLGFDSKAVNSAFNHVPDTVTRNIVTGQVYDTGWSLSKSIWGDNQDTLAKAYEIVGGGLAKNQSVYEIAKELEQFVRPNAAKQWNLKDVDGRRIYPKSVDYNAQRLARTLTQHSYQQSLEAVIKPNPFVESVEWVANGSRVCPICLARNGTIYKKGKAPLDHPNGMCFLRVVIADNVEEQLAKWVTAPRGTYRDIDKFADALTNKRRR